MVARRWTPTLGSALVAGRREWRNCVSGTRREAQHKDMCGEDITPPSNNMEVKYEYYGQGNNREDTTVPSNSMETKDEYHGQGNSNDIEGAALQGNNKDIKYEHYGQGNSIEGYALPGNNMEVKHEDGQDRP